MKKVNEVEDSDSFYKSLGMMLSISVTLYFLHISGKKIPLSKSYEIMINYYKARNINGTGNTSDKEDS